MMLAVLLQVTGTVQYQDRTYDATGFTGTTLRAVRFADLEITRASDNIVLASGTTGPTGSFSLAGVTPGEIVYLRVYARAAGNGINAVVLNNAAQSLLYTVVTPPIDTSVTTTFGTVNITIAGGAAPAFNIFDCAVKGFEYLAFVEPALPPVPPLLQIYWQAGSTDGTYFDRTVNGIFLLGMASDPDEFDDDIIHHEIGHWMAWRFSKDDTLGGPHTIIDQLDPRTSWSEGFAHFWSALVRRRVGPGEYADPAVQVDNFLIGRSVFDIEGPDNPAQAVMATNELAVAAVLWDITDLANEGVDSLSGQEPEIWRAVSVQLPLRTDVTLEDFHAGLTIEALGIMVAVTAIFNSRSIKYFLDGSESNDPPSPPTALALGPAGLAARTIYPTDDEDWYTIDVTVVGTLVVETLSLGDGGDTLLELYDAAGTTLLATNDNRGPNDLSSLITRVVTGAATFQARVRRAGTVVEHGYYDIRARVVVNGPPTILSVAATATSGPAPLRVTFSASIDDPDGGSHEYQWDFNGDGRPDWFSYEGPTVTTTYDESGTFIAQLRVVDSGDTLVTAPVTITILPSSPATVAFSPVLSGPAPHLVNFNASVSGVIPTAYLWDVDGNGVYESASTTTALFPFTYRMAGTFFPRLLVRDSQGRAIRAVAPAITIAPGPSPPSIGSFTASSGIVPFASTLTVSHSDLGPSGTVEFDLDGDSRVDYVVAPGGPGGTIFSPEVQRAGDFTPRVRVTDSSGRSVFTTTTYSSRSVGVTGWMVDPRAGDRLAGSGVTLTAQAVPAGVSKSVQFQVRDAVGPGPWTDVGGPIVSTASLFSTTWNVTGLADLSTFDVRILIDGAVSSGDTTNAVVIDSAAPTISESGPIRTKTVRIDRTTVSRTSQGIWAIVPVGSTPDALPLTLEPAGSGCRVTFAGTFQNTWRLRLPGSGSNLEIHHLDEGSGVWQRLAYPRVSPGDGWVEAEVNAAGLYAPVSPAGSRGGGTCGATGLEALILLLLLRRRRC